MTIDEAKAYLKKCTDEERERFAVIGMLYCNQVLQALIRKLGVVLNGKVQS